MKRIFFLLCLILLSSSFTFYNKDSSYVVMEVSSRRVLKSSNMNEQLLIASTTKILTALTVIENYNLEDEVKIKEEYTKAVGSSVYLKKDEILTRKDLLYALLLRSANDAASALSDNDSNDFIIKMNELAKKIGMKNSIFLNSSGLDEKEYNLSTAYDMAILSVYASTNKTFVKISSSHNYQLKTNMGIYVYNNKHKLVKNNENFIWGKTGYTKKSRRILVSNYIKDNMNVVIVTINNSNDWSFHKSIIDNINDYEFSTIFNKGIYDYDKYYIIIKENIILPLLKKEKKNIKITMYIYPDSGYLIVYYKNSLIASYKILVYNEEDFNFDDYIIALF